MWDDVCPCGLARVGSAGPGIPRGPVRRFAASPLPGCGRHPSGSGSACGPGKGCGGLWSSPMRAALAAQ